jgi:CRP/FNR family cyclic AMP-dependent transcriptional regulator
MGCLSNDLLGWLHAEPSRERLDVTPARGTRRRARGSSGAKHPHLRLTMETADFLATVSLFQGLDRDELVRFAEIARERSYPKGSVILFEDDPGDSLYIVRTGRVKVVKVGEDGREVILGWLGVGDHFGELSLIDGQPRSAHVIAVDEAQMIILRREDFRRRVEESPAVAWALLTALSRRLRRADDQIGGLVLLDVPGRVARLLLDAAGEGGGEVVEKRLTHQTIAQMIGASRETVSRTMRDFQERGLIAVRGRQIAITDRPGLEAVAQVRA